MALIEKLFRRRKKAAMPGNVGQREHILSMRSDDAGSGSSGEFGTYTDVFSLSAWVYRAVMVIAKNAASVGLQVLVNGEPVENHPLAELLSRVNTGWTLNMLIEATVISDRLAGETFWYLEGGGKPQAIWWLRPDLMKVVPDRSKAAWYGAVSGYVYDDGVHEPIPFDPDEILHFKYFHPTDPYHGLAPITAARQSIIVDFYAQSYNKAFFRNSGRVDAVLESEEPLSDQTFERLRAQWEEKYRGAGKAHKVAILEGVTYKPISLPPKDAEWLEQRKLSREEICAVFGVPPVLVGAWEAANYATAMEAKRSFWEETVIPELEFIAGVIDEFLAPRYGQGVEVRFDYSKVPALREQIHRNVETAWRLFSMGVPLSRIDETLGLGLGEIRGADTGYLPVNLMPVTSVSEKPPAEPEKEVVAPVVIRRAPFGFGSAKHEALWRSFLSVVDPNEKALIRFLKKDFQRQQLAVNDCLRDGVRKPEELFPLEEEVNRFREEYEGFFRSVVDAAARRALLDLGLILPEPEKAAGPEIEGVWDLDSPEVQAFIREKVFRFARKVNETTLEQLRAELLEGEAAGEGIPQLMDRVAKIFGYAKDFRSERIARTEVVGASNGGAFRAYQQNGVKKKAWLAAIDERTRATHLEAHGRYAENPIPMDEPFEVGGAKLMYPGDPAGPPEEIINCRCTILPIVEV